MVGMAMNDNVLLEVEPQVVFKETATLFPDTLAFGTTVIIELLIMVSPVVANPPMVTLVVVPKLVPLI